jgi:hypothetical protein
VVYPYSFVPLPVCPVFLWYVAFLLVRVRVACCFPVFDVLGAAPLLPIPLPCLATRVCSCPRFVVPGERREKKREEERRREKKREEERRREKKREEERRRKCSAY